MENICFMGNSHLACVKKAWDLKKDRFDGFDISFFGSHSDSYKRTELRDGVIVALDEKVENSFSITSGGKTGIDLSAYDTVVLHGFLPSIKNYNRLKFFFESNFYTESFKFDSFYGLSPTFGVVSQYFHDFKGKVIVSPKPLPSLKDESNAELLPYSNECVEEFIQSWLDIKGMSYLPQPKETLLNIENTKREYSRYGLGLGGVPNNEQGQVLSDANISHMNEKYGEVILYKLFELINCA